MLVKMSMENIPMNPSMKKTGLIVGKFYPLHQGHLHMILSAKLQVEELHIFICSETDRDWQLYLESQFTKAPTPQNRENWAQELLQHIPGISIHGFNEDGIPSYPNGWEAWSNRLKETLDELHIQPTLIFSSEPQDKAFYETHFQVPVQLVDPPRDTFPVSATKIRERPFDHWNFIPAMIRPFFTRTILIDMHAFTNPAILLALETLFNAVEIPNYQKISLMPISKENITSTIQNFQNSKQIISAIIGSKIFINQIIEQSSLGEFLVITKEVHTFIVPALSIQDKNLDENLNSNSEKQILKDISLFIHHIEQNF